MSKHTPPPWSMSKVQKDNAIYAGNSTVAFSAEVSIYPPDAAKDEDQHAGPIAIVSVVEGMDDANLILAAPDLLAACEAVAAAYSRYGSTKSQRESQNLIRAAIAKAKGGAS